MARSVEPPHIRPDRAAWRVALGLPAVEAGAVDLREESAPEETDENSITTMVQHLDGRVAALTESVATLTSVVETLLERIRAVEGSTTPGISHRLRRSVRGAKRFL